MSTTLFASQWNLQKSGLRLPFIALPDLQILPIQACFLAQLSGQLNSHFGHFVLWCVQLLQDLSKYLPLPKNIEGKSHPVLISTQLLMASPTLSK